MNVMQFVIITGMSGSGKSSAVNVLEDIGYYCVDNMPPELIPKFYELHKCCTYFAVLVNVFYKKLLYLFYIHSKRAY